MPNIQTLNKIAACGLRQFPAGYTFGETIEEPAAVLVRSASMHDTPLDPATAAIARAGAGVNNIPIDACTAAGVCVFNTPGANANAVKELVICGLFLASRKIAEGVAWEQGLKGQGENVGKAVEKGKGAFVGPEILGKTLGVVGLGAIGALVANAAAALGMDVLGYDPYLSDDTAAALAPTIKVVGDLDELYAASDYISLHIPLVAATKGSFNAETIAKCKGGVRLLNFARDGLVNSADLITALNEGKVAAYVTDFATDDLLGVANVTAIPHLGASTPESEDNCAVMAAQQVLAYLERGEIKNSVNFPSVRLPEKFTYRVTVVYENHEGLTPAILEAFGIEAQTIVTNTRGPIAYTAADFEQAPNTEAVAELEGILRIRVIQ